VGLTPRLLAPEEDALLLDFGIGLTDLAKGVSGMDREIPLGKLRPDVLRDLVARYRPGILAFNGKGAARAVMGKGVSDFGRYDPPGLPTVWVLPSTSGAARWCFSLDPWRGLADTVLKSSVR
jgi:TDG/mug DNA glycosylase family protein